jgi:hypothetical protein
MQMKNVLRRPRVLERLPQFVPPPSRLEQLRYLALRQISDEDLAVMIKMARDREQGVCRMPLPTELAALATQDATLEREARRIGFRSFADAERRAGQRR